MASALFNVGDLTVVIGDNTANAEHRAGYNGIWSLIHRTEPQNLFVPAYAGFNFEHIFDGDRCDSADRARFCEPRVAPMTFTQVNEAEGHLHQPPTPTFALESRTRFRISPPHYIDVAFDCTPTRAAFPNGYLGLFWASYINAPDDRSMYFRHNGIWQQLCTQAHCHESCVRHPDDELKLPHREGIGDALFMHDSLLRFDEPFFFGCFRDHVLIVIFDRMPFIRLAHSPGGGGLNQERGRCNPAWDFMQILPGCQVAARYTLRARLVYRERCSRQEILNEVARYQSSTDDDAHG